MTLATMADRTLPLAERVQAALLCWDMDDSHEAARAALLADIAAADRLARATDRQSSTRDVAMDRLYAAPDPIRGTDTGDAEADSEAAYREYEDALDAYRARMQGVADGE